MKIKGQGWVMTFFYRLTQESTSSIEYKGTRKHFIKGFPYNLVEKEKIIILAVIHGKRRPDLIKKTIDSI